MKEFVINDFLTLKLEEGKTNIYMNGERFYQCKFLMLNVPMEETDIFDEIESIDEVADLLGWTEKGQKGVEYKIDPESKFWGHCSNLQAWFEHDYNTRLLHSSLSFPLLEKLTEVGDPLASNAFAVEISKRLKTGGSAVLESFLENSYLSYLSNNEISNVILYWLDMETLPYEIYEQLVRGHDLTALTKNSQKDWREIREFFLQNLTSGNIITQIKNAYLYLEKDSWNMMYHFLNEISWKCLENYKIAISTISLNCSSIWLNEFNGKKDERILNSLSKIISFYYYVFDRETDFSWEYYHLIEAHIKNDHDIRKIEGDLLDRVFNPKKNYSEKDIFLKVKRIAKEGSVYDIFSLFKSGILLLIDEDQLMLLEFSWNIFEIRTNEKIIFELRRFHNDYEDFISILWSCNTNFRNTLIREVFEGDNNEAISFIIENTFFEPFYSSEFFLSLPTSSLRKVIRNLINSIGYVFEDDSQDKVRYYLEEIVKKGEPYQKIVSEEILYVVKNAPEQIVVELMAHDLYKSLNKTQLLALFSEPNLLEKTYSALNKYARQFYGDSDFTEIHLNFYSKSLEVVPEKVFIKLFHDEKKREQIISDLLHNYLCSGALRDNIGIRVLEIIAKRYNTPTEIFEINFDGEPYCFIIYDGILDISGRKNLDEVDLRKIKRQNLRSLTIKYTKIRDIRAIKGIDNLANLKELRLFDNEIEEIKDMDAFISLKVLSLGNQIREIKGLEKLVNLEKLSLGKQIEEIKGLEALKNLKTLSLASNKIKKIKGLENLSSLKELNLGYNQIEEIKGIEKLKDLEKLNLTNNRLIEVNTNLESLPNLTELNLSYNKIKDLNSSSVLKKLKQRGVKIYYLYSQS